MSVLIYQDYHENNAALFCALITYFGHANVSYIDAQDIIDGKLSHETQLFVIPGGADLFYCEKLDGAGNAAIKSYVEKGGTYLGICAGAYYACRELNWADGDIAGGRELTFYDGTAKGPIKAITNSTQPKHWDAAVTISFGNIKTKSLYAAGPLFEGSDNMTVLARYNDLEGHPPAIIECTVGQGKAILSSIHPEYNFARYKKALYVHENDAYAHQKSVAAALQNNNSEQEALWNALLDHATGA